MHPRFRTSALALTGVFLAGLSLVFWAPGPRPAEEGAGPDYADDSFADGMEFGGREADEKAIVGARPSSAEDLADRDATFAGKPENSVREISSAFSGFELWTENYLAAGEEQRRRLLAEGLALAERRRDVLAGLIVRDPEAALANAVPREIRSELPAEILDLLEIPFDDRADFEVFTGCAFEDHNHADNIHRVLHLEDETVEAFTYGARENLPTKFALPVHGIRLDGAAAVHENPARFLEPGEMEDLGLESTPGDGAVFALAGGEVRSFGSRREAENFADYLTALETEHGPYTIAEGEFETAAAPAASWTTGEKTVLYLRLDLDDIPGDPVRREIAESAMDEAASFFAGNSGGKVAIEGAVFPETLRLPHSSAHYRENGYMSLREAALYVAATAAENDSALAEFHPDDFDAVIFAFPQIFSNWIGRATIGGPSVWLNGFFSPGVTIHELGHTFGLFHANAWEPSGHDPIGDGRHIEYADVFDIMGISSNVTGGDFRDGHFNAWFKAYLGWLEEEEDWIEPTETGVYRLARHDRPDSEGVRAIRVPLAEGRAYWLDFRGAFADVETGAGIRRAHTQSGLMSREGSQLLDMTPRSTDGWLDHPLAPGNTFSDYERAVYIRTVDTGGSDSGQWVDVEVRLDENPPPLITSHPEGRAGIENHSVTFRVEAVGSSSLQYQWFFDHTEIPGAMNSSLRIDPIEPRHAGRYSVKVWNEFGTVFSEPADLQVLPPDAALEGALDDSFDPGAGPNGPVYTIAEQADGRLLIGGNFTSVNGVSRNSIARLQPDGSLDHSFDPGDGFDEMVWTLALDAEGRIYAGGAFTTFSGQATRRIVRLQADGSLDYGFSAGADGTVRTILPRADGRVLVGGAFTTFNNQPAGRIAMIFDDGVSDPGFDTGEGFDGAVWTLAETSDGGILAGGAFGSFDDREAAALVKLTSGGWQDPGFQVDGETNGAVYALAVQSDGRIVAGGSFTRIGGNNAGHITRLLPDGSPDTAFQPESGANDIVWSVAVDKQGQIILGGWFDSIDDQTRGGIGRIHSNGDLDDAFLAEPGADDVIWPAVILDDGKILTGGRFTRFNGQTRNRLARIFTSAPESTTAATSGTFADWIDANGTGSEGDHPEEDPGGTGIPNLLRYAFHLDAHNPSREGMPAATLARPADDGNARYLAIRFTRRTDAADLNYVVESSADMENWTPIESPQISAIEATGENSERVTVLDEAPIGSSSSPQRFLRVRVQLRD